MAETINDRIAQLIDTLGVTKTAFAENLKISQQYASKLIRTGTPSDLLIDDICQKYNVNEEWLRTGTGDMFILLPEEDETAVIVSNLLFDSNPFYDIILAIMKTYQNLDSKSQELLLDYSETLLKELKKKGESQ